MSRAEPQPPCPVPVEAAVLVPVFRAPDGGLRLVVVRRAAGGVHGGQLAFPGGKRDPGDPSLLATALREAEEEIGLARERVAVLAALDPVETVSTGFRIAPFLGRVVRPPAWRPHPPEIEEVIEWPVAALARPGAHGEACEPAPGGTGRRRVRFYRVGPHRLWGASYRILAPLLPRLLAGEWDV